MKLRLLSRSLLAGALGAIALVSPLRAQGGPLVPGQRLEAILADGAVHRYTVSLAAGRYAHVAIEETTRPNVIVRLLRSDGFSLDGLADLETASNGKPDRIVLIAEQDCDYTIEVRFKDGLPGAYAIQISDAGELTATERTRFEAQRVWAGAIVAARAAGWTDELRAELGRSRSMFHAIQDVRGEIDMQVTLAHSHVGVDLPAAVAAFRELLEMARRAGDLRVERQALNNAGVLTTLIGDPRQAAEYLRQAIDAGRRQDPKVRDSTLVHNLAVAYRDAGEYQIALEYGREALAGGHATGDIIEAYAANNLGSIHLALGDVDAALENFTLGLERFRSERHATGMARALQGIGMVRAVRDDHRGAIDSFRESIQEWQRARDQGGEAIATSRLAMSLTATGRAAEADDTYQRALTLSRQAGTRLVEAEVLRSLGDIRASAGERQPAAQLLAEALAISQTVEDRVGEATTRLSLARLARDDRRFAAARAQIERALELVESLRTTVSNPDLRAAFVSSKRDYYDFYIDLLMQMHRQDPAAGHDAAALLVSESGRARSLIDVLTEVGADIRAGAPSALLEQERVSQQEVTVKAARVSRILSAAHTPAEAATARADLQHAVSAYEDAQARVRAESPRYAALAQPEALDVRAIRERLLDADTALVEYALGAERSFVWVVSQTSLTVHDLPKRSDIESAARQAYELMAASDRREVWGPSARANARLSQLIVAPVARELGYKRLLVVADGALNYVPFAALPHPATGAPLVATHEIVNLPSASALTVIRDEAAGRRPARNVVAVLADPVLSPSDARVNGAPATTDRLAAARSDLLRSATESGILHFDRLAFTRDEANAIAAVAGGGRSMVSLDFDASRATALGTALADYRVVHFATHGLINSANPQLSGLVLSLVDRQGHQQDGFVRLHDIYSMKLAADLVVLSACRTALGKDVRGEGLVGMTRGFMYAGAPRVVASLWDVRDRATAELMTRFYSRMLTGGLSPAAALRAAQVSMWKEPRWQAPFNWAGFVIQGEWK